jgi:hypothetical protein
VTGMLGRTGVNAISTRGESPSHHGQVSAQLALELGEGVGDVVVEEGRVGPGERLPERSRRDVLGRVVEPFFERAVLSVPVAEHAHVQAVSYVHGTERNSSSAIEPPGVSRGG